MKLGDTFYWRDGGHLWVVVSDPALHSGEFVIVNLTKDVFRAGMECPLAPGEHRWITQTTYVTFGDARKMGPKEEANLAVQITLGTIRMHSPVSLAVLTKIISAGKVSKAIPEALKTYL